MKKLLLILFSALLSLSFITCEGKPIDVSVTEAFSMMNEAIENYRSAESLELRYHGQYSSTIHQMQDDLFIRMRNMGTDKLISNISINMFVDDIESFVQTYYQKGMVYTYLVKDNKIDKTYKTQPQSEFEALYTLFLKQTIDKNNTQNVVLSTTSKILTLTFELASADIEKTLYVLPVMDFARSANVVISFTKNAQLISMSVEYEAEIDDVYGDFNYSVEFVKINSYVIVPALSASKIGEYKEVQENEE